MLPFRNPRSVFMGVELGLLVLAGTVLGHLLDRLLGLRFPVMLVLLFLAGAAAGFALVFRTLAHEVRGRSGEAAGDPGFPPVGRREPPLEEDPDSDTSPSA